jgi:hypothetical protein
MNLWDTCKCNLWLSFSSEKSFKESKMSNYYCKVKVADPKAEQLPEMSIGAPK